MRRPLFAIIPHRGVVWTGVSRAALSDVRAEKSRRALMVTFVVDARVSDGVWVLGEPEVWSEASRAGTSMPWRVFSDVPEGTSVTLSSKSWAAKPPGSVSVTMEAGRAFGEPDRDGRFALSLEMTTVSGDRITVSDAGGTVIEAKLDWDVRIRLDWLDGQLAYVVAHCVEILADVDEGTAKFLFCGVIDGAELQKKLERVGVAVVPRGLEEPWWAELPRAVFRRCAIAEDIERSAAPSPLTEEEQKTARFSTWDIDEPPSRLLDEAEAAKIFRKLALGYDRDEVLGDHGLDAYEWAVEERAIAMSLAADVAVPEEAFAESSDQEDDSPPRAPWSPAEGFAARLAANQPKLEPRLTMAAFALVTASLEHGDSSTLEKHALSEASYAAEEDAWSTRAEVDPQVAEQLSLELERARSAAELSLRERVANWTGEAMSTETEEAS